jgi:hypothetical protein
MRWVFLDVGLCLLGDALFARDFPHYEVDMDVASVVYAT